MPQAVVAIAYAAAAEAATTALAKFVVAVVFAAISSSLNKRKQAGFQAEAVGRQQVVRSPVEDRRIIYGQSMVSGPLVFGFTTGSDREFLHLGIALAGHEVEEIGDVYFGDKLSTEYDSDFFRITKHLGSINQVADPDLVSEVPQWTTDHRLRGIAYLYVRLKYSPKVWPNGIPNIKCLVKGKKLYDPRTATTYWTDNSALCIRDYLLSNLGVGAQPSEINESSFIAAANISDEDVNGNKRYTCNGTIDLGISRRDNIGQLLTSIGGMLPYTLGKYEIIAGAYQGPSTLTLTGDDFRGEIKISPYRSRKNLFNQVRGTFVNPDKFWQPADFAPVVNALYKSQDNGEDLINDVDFSHTINDVDAQRLAKLELEKNRNSMQIEAPLKWIGASLKVGSVITLNLPEYSITNKEFMVMEWQLADGGVDVVLQEEDPDIYLWNNGEETTYDLAPNITLTDATDQLPITGLSADSGTAQLVRSKGAFLPTILVTWNQITDAYLKRYEIEYKKSTESNYQGKPVTEPLYRIKEVAEDDIVDIRVRSINIWDVPSEWDSIQETVVGKTAPPATPSGLQTIGIQTGINAKWTGVSDQDLSHYEVAVSDDNNRANADIERTHKQLPSFIDYIETTNDRFFWVRSVDTSGNTSDWFPSGATSGVLGNRTLTRWSDVYDDDGTAPAPNASVPAPNASVKINFSTFATPNDGELYIHGFNKNGQAADVDGFVSYDGQNLTLPRSIILTGIANRRGYLLFDTSGGEPFIVNGLPRKYCFAVKTLDSWEYDNNGGLTAFTPSDSIVAIGDATLGASNDLVRRALIWASARDLDVLPEPQSTRGTPIGTFVGPRPAVDISDTILGGRRLADDVVVDQGNGTNRRANYGGDIFSIQDGDGYNFAQSWQELPIISFGSGGLSRSASLSGDTVKLFRADNLTSSGFDAYLKLTETVGSTTDVTESGAVNTGSLDWEINKANANQAYNSQYTFQFDVTIANEFDTELGWLNGNAKVGIYTNDGSGWVKRAERTITVSGASSSTTQVNNETLSITVTGLTNHGGREFGVELESSRYAGSSVSAFDNVKYQVATPPTEASATPAGVSANFSISGGR